ncbi:expansin EXLX1 family cellulose-binding protein [Acrocarpospora corrugata]|uniref:expansin EXLX1 family cellulose-binding protein n=1 Tax=Acrocarpospora corrugata TaxID=35763 RepID=UPI00147863F4|nr:expansin EXLX1 family cellulose-binding protein [Acrocarpospora corrugata]
MAGAAVLAVAVAVPVTWTAACADTENGRAYFYDPVTGPGNCSLPASGRLFVSVAAGEYAGSAACGGYLDVTGPRGTVRVQVVDQCTKCRKGDLDLSRPAFSKIAEPEQGVARVVYDRVRNPEVARPLAFRVKAGSSIYWLAVQVLDHGNPLRTVRIRDGAHWRDLRRGGDNYWVFEHSPGEGPFTIKVTDVFGQHATASGVDLAPGRVQRTTKRLYGESAVTPVTQHALPAPPTPIPPPRSPMFC